MQFDDFDKKIKDAAEHHHPDYEEKAWEKMEALLDKHLPVKRDDRRRIIFLLLLLLILGSGAYFLIRDHNKQTDPPLTREQTKDVKKPVSSSLAADTKSGKARDNNIIDKDTISTNKSNNPKSNNIKTTKSNDRNGLAAGNTQQTKTSHAEVKENLPALTSFKKITRQPRKGENVAGYKYNQKNIAIGAAPNKTPGNIDQHTKTAENNQPDITIKSTNEPVNIFNQAADQKSDVAIIATRDSAIQKKSDQQDFKPEEKNIASAKKKDTKKTVKQKQSSFAVTFTTGPDLSFVGISKLGKVKMRYGAGLGYTYKRFMLRSGFYVTKKIYSASASDYHPYYANLEKVDGDCQVFEIPVTIAYSFKQAKNHNFFVSTGLSSYLMKKETYGYLHKDPVTGWTDYYSHSWNNKNKHYFSVLNLSAAYERKFTKSISLIAEPYLQVPLAGIGNGKIKLNSAGVSLTLSIKPFAGRK